MSANIVDLIHLNVNFVIQARWFRKIRVKLAAEPAIAKPRMRILSLRCCATVIVAIAAPGRCRFNAERQRRRRLIARSMQATCRGRVLTNGPTSGAQYV